MKKILFTPVGSTDPISGGHDGALLHIIRVFKPEVICIYMSKEICELEAKDGRYTYCLNKIKELLKIEFEIEYIKRQDLVDVHIFDYFLAEFREILEKLDPNNNEILLNVSSGTPAMKSALQILSNMFDSPMKPIQVSTPKKMLNDREDIKGDYCVDIQWEINEDNQENFKNRCTISPVINFSLEIKKAIIKKHIKSFNYVAALEVAEPISDFIKPEAINLIRASVARLKLDRSTYSRLCKESNYKLCTIEASDQTEIFEYLMLMKIRVYKEEYADFLRALSPLFFVLLERIIMNSGINLDEYIRKTTEANNTIKKKWDRRKIKNNELFKDIKTNGDYDPVVVTEDYCKLLKKMDIDKNVMELVENIREIERNLRNPIAHSITFVTNNVIEKYANVSAEQLFEMIKKLTITSGINIKKEDMKTYEKLNTEIEKYLQSAI